MGLDMYLVAEYRLSWDNEVRQVFQKRLPQIEYWPKSVSFEVAYWRKVNAIHKWFVDNVQEGEDNCGRYYVARYLLEDLLNLCQEVLDKPELAEDLLPTCGGFFFGPEEYGEYYIQGLEETVHQINKALALPENDFSFYYQSNW